MSAKLQNLCLTCANDADCPMPELLESWREIEEEWIDDNVPDAVYEENYIDDPDCVDGEIVWCPMHRHYAIIITFGQVHAHRINNQTFDKDCVARIKCSTHEEGRKIAFELFGDKWFTSYDENFFDEKDMLKFFPRGKIDAN